MPGMHLKAQRMGQCSPLAQGCQLSLGLIMAAFGMQVGVVAGVELDNRSPDAETLNVVSAVL